MEFVEKYCLRWSDFGRSVSRSFACIRENNQFFDCTLTTDEDEEYSDNLKAHKVILAASSEFFHKLLARESLSTHTNPLIYLKGISPKDLKSILDFIYNGEVNVAHDELNKFLEAAETLKIQGLAKNFKIETPKDHGLSLKKRPLKPLTNPLSLEVGPIKKPKMNITSGPSSSTIKLEPQNKFRTENQSSVNFTSNEVDHHDFIGEEDMLSEHFHDKENEELHDNQTSCASARGKCSKTFESKPFHKGKHLSKTEQIILVNLIKTLDKEDILRRAGKDLKNETIQKKKALWSEILPAFNEISGLNCDVKKLKRSLYRIKSTPSWKSHSHLYDDSAL